MKTSKEIIPATAGRLERLLGASAESEVITTVRIVAARVPVAANSLPVADAASRAKPRTIETTTRL